MATESEKLTVRLEAATRQYENAMAKALGTTQRQLAQAERSLTSFKAKLNSSFNFNNINAGLASLGLAISGREIIRYADQWTEASNRLRTVGVPASAVADRLKTLNEVANRSRAPLSTTVDLYSKLAIASNELGLSQNDILQITESVSKALAISGASAAEADGAIRQLSQALASGRLNGDELNSILENSPIIARAIAKEFGVAVGQLKALGAQGKLTSDRIAKALLTSSKEIEGQFSRSSTTVAQSFTILQNNLTAYLGTVNDASGGTRVLNNGLLLLANNLGVVADAAVAIGAIFAVNFARKGIGAVISAARYLAPVLAGLGPLLANPIGAFVAAVAAAGTALYAFGDLIPSITSTFGTLRDDMDAAFGVIGDWLKSASDGVATLISTLATSLGQLATNVMNTGKAIADAIVTPFRNAIVGVTNGLKNIINQVYRFGVGVIQAMKTIPEIVSGATITAINKMVGVIEGALNGVIKLVNSLITDVNKMLEIGNMKQFELVPEINLSRIEQDGAAAGKGFRDAFNSALSDLDANAAAVSVADDFNKPDLFTAVGQQVGNWISTGIAATVDPVVNAYKAKRYTSSAQRDEMLAYSYTPPQDMNARSKPTPIKPAVGGKSVGLTPEDVAKQTQEMNALAEAYKYATASGSAYEIELQLLQNALMANKVITPELEAAYRKQAEALAAASGQVQQYKDAQAQLAEMQQTFESAVMSGIDAILSGAKSAKDAVKDMVKQILSEFVKLQIKTALFGSGTSGGGLFSGLFSGGGGGFLSGLFGGPRAAGGPVSAGKAYLVGERGPELFAPRASGRIIPNKAISRSGGGGSGKPIVNVYNQNGSAVATQTRRVGGREHIDVIITEVNRRMAEGQFDKSMRSRFGVGPRLVER